MVKIQVLKAAFPRIEGVDFRQGAFKDGRRQVIGRIGIRPPVAEIFEYRRVVLIELLAQVDGLAGCGLRQISPPGISFTTIYSRNREVLQVRE